jgi:pre-rRNA-processing protein TSR1
MPNHHHRQGGLSQSNKKNKRSNASKRSVSRAAGGRVNVKSSAYSNLSADTKANRRHKADQRRQASRQSVLQKRRGLTGGAPPPRIVGIISLAENSAELEERVRDFALKTADLRFTPSKATVTAKYNLHKKDGTLTFLTNSTSCENEDDKVMAALDLCRICDLVLFIIDGNGINPDDVGPMGMQVGADAASVSTNKSGQTTQDWDHLVSSTGDRILSAVKAQGLPTPITVLAQTVAEEQEDYMTMKSAKSVRRSALKRKLDLKKYVGRFATTEFGVDNDRVLEIDLTTLDDEDEMDDMDEDDDMTHMTHTNSSSSSSAALVRTLCTVSASPPKWVSEAQRPYIVSDTSAYNASEQRLCITGYVRGNLPWDTHSLLHIPNLGTFTCHGVKKAQAPFSHGAVDGKMVLADPMKIESLDMFAMPDALEGEQNLVGFDEDAEEDEEDEEEVARPTGWSDYQSAWLDAVDDVSHGADEFDRGELAKELNQKKSSSASVGGGMDMDDDDDDVSPEERQALVDQRRKTHKEDLEFPDEVNVPEDMKASDRFARYRSLKSFRTSHWDPKEALPDDYSAIYHFKSFKATQRDIKADMNDVKEAAKATMGDFWGSNPSAPMNKMVEENSDDDEDLLDGCVPSGSYVTMFVEQVSLKAYSRIAQQGVLCAAGLLPHENKVSVLHMGLSQTKGCDQTKEIPVKSKDFLTFRCGWRTWKARPVFSQNNLNSDKHKFERYLPQGGAFFAASVYGPVSYAPCPVLVFREREDADRREMVALGSMMSADADRIVVKRIVLTGFPVRVHKRTATIKYMFYNPDDVRWFKPAGLYTKHGLNGHIVSSAGEHGTMKCLFSAPIKQHDTVCLPLYKRIFPKFANTAPTSEDGATVKSVITKEALLVL